MTLLYLPHAFTDLMMYCEVRRNVLDINLELIVFRWKKKLERLESERRKRIKWEFTGNEKNCTYITA